MTTERPFAQETFARLLELVSARTPTPGGGSVAALCGALGAALGCMAVRFSMKRRESTVEHEAVLEPVERGLLECAARLAALADADAASFEAVRQARKFPQATDAERAARDVAIRSSTLDAAEVPMRTARICREAMELLDGVASALNPNLATDGGSGATLLRSGVRCAGWNVLVNLVGDASPAAAARRLELDQLLARTAELEQRLVAPCERLRPT